MIGLILAAALLGGQQNLPEVPSTTTTSSSAEYRTVGDEFHKPHMVKAEVTVFIEWSLEDTHKNDLTNYAAMMPCGNYCNGQKHKSHAECDTSCDTPCNLKHEAEPACEFRRNYLDGFVVPGPSMLLDYPVPDYVKQEDYGKGLDDHPRPTRIAFDEALAEVVEPFLRMRVKLHAGHITNPCSYGRINFPFHVYLLKGHSITKHVVTVDGVEKRQTDDEHFVAGRIWVPVTEPVIQIFGTGCRCEPASAKEPKDGMVGLPRPFDIPDNEGIKVVAVDMNNATIQPEPPTDKPFKLFIPPGTELIPDDSRLQNLMILYGGVFTFPILSASLNGVGPAQVRVACINLHKAPPENATYHLGTVKDPVLSMLAYMGKDDLVQGRLDQLRTWIRTDAATLEDINGVLFPKARPADYLQSLYDVNRVGGLDLSKPDQAKCLDPNLILGTGANAASIAWFVQTLTERNPKGLAKAMIEARRRSPPKSVPSATQEVSPN